MTDKNYIQEINSNNEDIEQIHSTIDFLNKQKEKIEIEKIINYIKYGTQYNLSQLPEENFNEYSFIGSILENGIFIFKEDFTEKNLNMIYTIFQNSSNYPIEVNKYLLSLYNTKSLFNNFNDFFVDFIDDSIRNNLSDEYLLSFLFFNVDGHYFLEAFTIDELLLNFGISIYDEDSNYILFEHDKNGEFLIYSPYINKELIANSFLMLSKPITVKLFNSNNKVVFDKNSSKEYIIEQLSKLIEELKNQEIPL